MWPTLVILGSGPHPWVMLLMPLESGGEWMLFGVRIDGSLLLCFWKGDLVSEKRMLPVELHLLQVVRHVLTVYRVLGESCQADERT